ncbi:MAG: tetratricopeptide repeat protein [Rhodospirillales bacterium]|nr:tetratricopeptide repeat protein [Rhodospirillales bacterium]
MSAAANSTSNDISADQFAEAEVLAVRILDSNPDNAEAKHALGLVRVHQKKWKTATSLLQAAVDQEPARSEFSRGLINALDGLAKYHADNGDFVAARETFQRALKITPDDARLLAKMSFVLTRLGRSSEALAAADRASSLNPDLAEADDARGLAFAALERGEMALESYHAALQKNPDYMATYVNLGNSLMHMGDFAGAMDCYEHVIRHEGGEIGEDVRSRAHAYNNLGLALAGKLQYAEAEAVLRQAVAIDTDFAEAHFNLARMLLMQGKYEEGWRENEWRWMCPDFPSTRRKFRYPVWQGEDVSNQKILVWSEQGIGDEIMFAGVLPDLIAAGADVVLECGERLVPIFRRSFPGAVVVARANPPGPQIRGGEIDLQIPMGSLPAYLRKFKDDFKRLDGAYLRADPERRNELREAYEALGPGLIVGICWRSGNPTAGAGRSAPLPLWKGILDQTGCTFVSLQYGDVDGDIAEAREIFGTRFFVDKEVDPLINAEDWFAQVAAVDMVISVDNSTIQVSGSLGIPTLTLLSHAPEWRFGMAGETHDWHPTVRVFRQSKPGEWAPAIERLAKTFRVCLDGA